MSFGSSAIKLFPAHAGVIPDVYNNETTIPTFSRTRGGGNRNGALLTSVLYDDRK